MGGKKSAAPAPAAQPAPTVTYNTTPINRESQARMAAAQRDANEDTPTGLIAGASDEEEKRRQGLLTGMATS